MAKARKQTAKPKQTTKAKQTAKPKQIAKAEPAEDYPFPFYGEGLASYFEWAELQVWFAKPPTVAERRAIAKGMPRPLAKSLDWDGPVLSCGNGDQQANLAIREAYPPKGKERWASKRQLEAFAADTNAWLLRTHETFPIVFAARREDAEAGGTKLGPWHDWSAKRIAEHYARVDAAPAKVKGLRAWALATPLQIMKYRDKKFPAKYVAWLKAWYARR